MFYKLVTEVSAELEEDIHYCIANSTIKSSVLEQENKHNMQDYGPQS